MTRKLAWMNRRVGRCAIVVVALTLGGAVAAHAQTQTYACFAPGGFGFVPPLAPPALPPVLLGSLKAVPNPVIPKDPATGASLVRGDLTDYIAKGTTPISAREGALLGRAGRQRQQDRLRHLPFQCGSGRPYRQPAQPRRQRRLGHAGS